jgi:hypothetical protein
MLLAALAASTPFSSRSSACGLEAAVLLWLQHFQQCPSAGGLVEILWLQQLQRHLPACGFAAMATSAAFFSRHDPAASQLRQLQRHLSACSLAAAATAAAFLQRHKPAALRLRQLQRHPVCSPAAAAPSGVPFRLRPHTRRCSKLQRHLPTCGLAAAAISAAPLCTSQHAVWRLRLRKFQAVALSLRRSNFSGTPAPPFGLQSCGCGSASSIATRLPRADERAPV